MDQLAAVAAQSPHLPPVLTPLQPSRPPGSVPSKTGGRTTGNRGEASKLREKAISSAKHKTWKMYELLKKYRWVSEPGDSLKALEQMLERGEDWYHEENAERYAEHEEFVEEYERRFAYMEEAREQYQELSKSLEKAHKQTDAAIKSYEELTKREDNRCAVAQARREDWKVFETKAIADVARWDAEKPELEKEVDELRAELKQLRPLKYAETRRLKGKVGTVHVCADCGVNLDARPSPARKHRAVEARNYDESSTISLVGTAEEMAAVDSGAARKCFLNKDGDISE